MRNVAEGLFVAGTVLLVWLRVGQGVIPLSSTPWLLLFAVAHLLLAVGLGLECVVLLRWGMRRAMTR